MSTSNRYGVDEWVNLQYLKTLTGILCSFDTLKQTARLNYYLAAPT